MKKLCFLVFFGFNLFAQKADSTYIKSFVSVTFGNKSISRNAEAKSSKIDYFNYILDDDNQQLGIHFRKGLKKRDAFAISMLLFLDMEPRNFEISYSKLITSYFGYFAGFKTFGYYFYNYPIVDFENEFKGFYNFDSNLKYRYINQPSFNLGPMYYLSRNRITFEGKINFRLGVLGKFSDSIFLKNITTFEVAKINLKSKYSPYLAILPDLNFTFFPLVSKKGKIGLVAHINYQNIRQKFNYSRAIYNWTDENPKIEYISGPKHHFKNLDLDFGINWQF